MPFDGQPVLNGTRLDLRTQAFHVREATVHDVPALARLHVQTFNETHERLYSASGEFHGGYGWRDLYALVARCGHD